MTMSKAYGPTGVSYMMMGSDFIEVVQSGAECRLELGCGGYAVLDLSKHTVTQLDDIYQNSHGFTGWIDDGGPQVVQFSKLLRGPSLY